MYRIRTRTHRTCDGVTRRDFLRVGTLSMLGLGLPEFLRLRSAQAATAGKGRNDAAGRDPSCIFIFLSGGPSTMDMWDLKPDAPSEFRGEFKPIGTNVPGIQICEHLPRMARVADKFAILRSVSHPHAGHAHGAHFFQTGVLPGPQFQDVLDPMNEHPSLGSFVSHERGISGVLPPYIAVPKQMGLGGPAFLGAAHAPFVIPSDPASPDFRVRDVDAPRGVDERRLRERRQALEAIEGLERRAEEADAKGQAIDTFQAKAMRLVTSPEAKRAFEIDREPAALRDDYGWTSFGQSCLLARRLIEAGTRFVSVDHGGWDNHTTIFPTLRNDLLPTIDQGLSALLRDLDARGLLATTLVVMCGEFGRTPRVNKDGGRDHWPATQSVIVAGGGLKCGQVVGATDARAEAPSERPVGPQDVCATIYHVLGVDYRKEFHTPLGRPIKMLPVGGEPIRELL